jgi:hypothetical protein
VRLEGGGAVEYDWLVVALGAESDPRGVPGVRELATPFVTLDDARRVDARLGELEAAAAGGGAAPLVVVVGAGYAGVELATVLGERARSRGVAVRVVTPTDDILPGSPEGQRDAARKALAALGVQVETGAKVERLTPAAGAGDAVVAGSGGRCTVHVNAGPAGRREFEADLVVWTAGLAPASKFVKVGCWGVLGAGLDRMAPASRGMRAPGAASMPRRPRRPSHAPTAAQVTPRPLPLSAPAVAAVPLQRRRRRRDRPHAARPPPRARVRARRRLLLGARAQRAGAAGAAAAAAGVPCDRAGGFPAGGLCGLEHLGGHQRAPAAAVQVRRAGRAGAGRCFACCNGLACSPRPAPPPARPAALRPRRACRGTLLRPNPGPQNPRSLNPHPLRTPPWAPSWLQPPTPRPSLPPAPCPPTPPAAGTSTSAA